MINRGYFAIGAYRLKNGQNMGGLVRSAKIFGASFVFTIGRRFKGESSACGHDGHIPIIHYENLIEWRKSIPFNCKVVMIEISDRSVPLETFIHPERAIYLLGAEDDGLPLNLFSKDFPIVQLPGDYCLNVATAGSIVMYDRYAKQKL